MFHQNITTEQLGCQPRSQALSSMRRRGCLRLQWGHSAVQPDALYFCKCIEGSSHYLDDKQDFDVSSISRRRAFARNVEILFSPR